MENGALKENYGQYEIPDEIHLLFQVENELNKEGLSLSQIGFQPIDQFDPYPITPPDLIPFASTGGDGIHFGFLTDFHKISNLNEAPIVCVTPTNYPPIRYMARNLREFLDLAFSVPFVEMLESIWNFKNEHQILDLIREFEEDAPSEWQENRKLIFTRCSKVFGTKKVDVVTYLKDVKRERSELISITTLDGLGVVSEHLTAQSSMHFHFDENHKCDDEEVMRMKSFLKMANEVEKLAFIRDANYWYILSSGYDQAVWDLIIELMISLNLRDEAERVSDRC